MGSTCVRLQVVVATFCNRMKNAQPERSVLELTGVLPLQRLKHQGALSPASETVCAEAKTGLPGDTEVAPARPARPVISVSAEAREDPESVPDHRGTAVNDKYRRAAT